jgi:hypothetical protein
MEENQPPHNPTQKIGTTRAWRRNWVLSSVFYKEFLGLRFSSLMKSRV